MKNSQRILYEIKKMLSKIKSKVKFKEVVNNVSEYKILFPSIGEIIFKTIPLNSHSLRGEKYDNTIIFADETQLFDKQHKTSLFDNIMYYVGETNNSIFIETIGIK